MPAISSKHPPSISIGGLGRIKYIYNERGLVERKIIGKAIIEYAYNRRGLQINFRLKGPHDYINIEVERDGMGRVTNYKLSSSAAVKKEAFVDIFLFQEAFYDSSSQVLSFKAESTLHEFTYDHTGNLTAWKNENTTIYFEYYADQKLKRVKNGNTDIMFVYNPLGLRLKKITPEHEYEYLYDISGNLMYERIKDRQGNIREERMYIYIPGMLDRPEAVLIKKKATLLKYITTSKIIKVQLWD